MPLADVAIVPRQISPNFRARVHHGAMLIPILYIEPTNQYYEICPAERFHNTDGFWVFREEVLPLFCHYGRRKSRMTILGTQQLLQEGGSSTRKRGFRFSLAKLTKEG